MWAVYGPKGWQSEPLMYVMQKKGFGNDDYVFFANKDRPDESRLYRGKTGGGLEPALNVTDGSNGQTVLAVQMRFGRNCPSLAKIASSMDIDKALMLFSVIDVIRTVGEHQDQAYYLGRA